MSPTGRGEILLRASRPYIGSYSWRQSTRRASDIATNGQYVASARGGDWPGQVAKCAWLTCAATRKALAATVKLGFKPVLDGKNEVSTT